MKFKPKLILILCILIVFLTIYPSFIHAQSVDCPDIGEVDPDYPCPIDGGVSALLAIGIFYGVKKVFDTRKK
jgi:hypothetical protein